MPDALTTHSQTTPPATRSRTRTRTRGTTVHKRVKLEQPASLEDTDVAVQFDALYPHPPCDPFPIRAVSSATTPANLPLLSTYLGQLIPIINGGQVKGGVVAVLSSLLPPHAALPPPTPSSLPNAPHYPLPLSLPTFNRLSGVLQWSNCVCLFVNLLGGRYDNQFFVRVGEDDMRLSWFMAPSSCAESPLGERLIGAGEEGMAVLLFCRAEGCAFRYFGRLAYVKHEGSLRPVRFVWRLLDFERLRQIHEDEAARSLVD